MSGEVASGPTGKSRQKWWDRSGRGVSGWLAGRMWRMREMGERPLKSGVKARDGIWQERIAKVPAAPYQSMVRGS